MKLNPHIEARYVPVEEAARLYAMKPRRVQARFDAHPDRGTSEQCTIRVFPGNVAMCRRDRLGHVLGRSPH